MRKEQVFLAIVLVGTVVFMQGCVAVAVGVGAAGTVAYIRGDLEAVESENIEAVYEATQNALEELQLKVTKKAKDAMTATIIVRDAEDKKITIKLNATAENTTKLSIRVGMFGDERKSRMIYQKIRDNLKQNTK